MFLLPEAERLEYLVGSPSREIAVRPLVPFSRIGCDFLNGLSAALLGNPDVKGFPDLVTFAFWSRRGGVERLKGRVGDQHSRLGRGLAFHITPSNVPINFAYSFAFSLLAGNANIVRVPTRPFPQVAFVCDAVNQVLSRPEFLRIAAGTAFVRYEKSDDLTAAFSRLCDARIIWGGDEAIREIRKIGLPERSIDIPFADRYSFCAIRAESVLRLDAEGLKKLATGFFNDTYLMDQNACSSPHLVVWTGGPAEVAAARNAFWKAVEEVVAAKYDLQPIMAVDKFTQFCEDAIGLEQGAEFIRQGNSVFRVLLREPVADLAALRGRFGYFYELGVEDLERIKGMVTSRFQTMTCFGFEKERLTEFVLGNELPGIDRVVPIGQALDISLVWDGFDLVALLSRAIDIRGED